MTRATSSIKSSSIDKSCRHEGAMAVNESLAVSTIKPSAVRIRAA
jgi:hypothetical protein